MKIEFLGNFYLQPYLTSLELNFLTVFCSSVHIENTNDRFLGLYDMSVTKKNLQENIFVFDKDLDLKRNLEAHDEKQNSDLFPFLKSPVNFTEKSIKFELIDIKTTEEFIFFMQLISQSILFYYKHFFQNNCFSKVLDKEFFSFFNQHNFSGNLYFKLSEFGEIYRLTGSNEKISLFKGFYPAQIRGKNYRISSSHNYDRDTKKQLESYYNKLSIIDIKNNAIFDQDSTAFDYIISTELSKLLNYHTLTARLPLKNKDKINKI